MGYSVDTEKLEGERMEPMCFRLKTRYNSMTDWLGLTEEGGVSRLLEQPWGCRMTGGHRQRGGELPCRHTEGERAGHRT